MSRQTKVGKLVKQGMQGYEDDDYSSNQEQDLTKDQWQMVDTLMDMLSLTQSQAIKALQNQSFNFDKAVDKITRNRQKEKEKQEKEKKKKEKEKEQKQAKTKQEQLAKEVPQQVASRKSKEESQQSILPLQSKYSKAEEHLHRKSSQEQVILGPRKSSYVIQDIQTDHYNTQYPSLGISKDISPSNTINIVVVGHVDSGKSTLVGIFLKEGQMISKKEVHKNEKESKQMGMESFKHAWVTDSTEQQRIRGVTIDVGVKKIELGGKKVVFLDSPGHRDFIPNMITGAAQADYAILVIDTDNFQSSFVGGGQTKEHAYIVRSFGVHKLIVAMNKMDRIAWSVQRFINIKHRLTSYLTKIGFDEEAIIYMPISAINSLNITKRNMVKFQAQNISYNKSFIDVIADLDMPPRPIDKPFRMTITNVFEPQFGKLSGHCLSGKVQGGVLKKDDKLVILPLDTQCLVKEILVGGQKAKEAVVGDNIDIQIKLIDKTAFEAIKQGYVLSSIKYCVPVTTKIVVQALALDLQVPVLRGTEVVIYLATNKCPARITKINYIFNPSDGAILRRNPKAIKSNQCAEIQVELSEKMCAQLFCNYKIFGRVIIREKKNTLFVGTIKLIK